jgi:uncharacterized membrane protein
MSEPAPPRFDVVLRPHRSLSPTGFWVVMGILVVWSFVGGIVFLSVGAWPVIGFFGIDVALVYWAFRASYGDRRAHERLRLDGDTLTVQKVDKRGAEERFSFQSYWLQVRLDDQSGEGQVVLSSHGRQLVVGAFLAPEERAVLARELSAALSRARMAPRPT